MPELFVVAVPTLLPFRVKLIVLPLTLPLEVRVADRLTVPPNVPLAAATFKLVAVPPTRIDGLVPLDVIWFVPP
jgi:hypothetical protein